MKELLLLLCVAMAVFGQPTGVSVGTTPTQAVLRYTAPSALDVCTVEVSESPGLSPLVHDVDPALFAGADEDDRHAVNVGTTRRVFVVGLRTSAEAADGKLYSRALAQNTGHYFEVTCTGGSVTGQFATAPVGWGDLKPESPPVNAAGFGKAAWPTIDWSDRLRWYVDPMSGIKYKPLGFPSDYAWTYPSSGGQYLFGTDRIAGGSGWTNASNIRSGSAASVATTSNTNAIFVGIDPSVTLIFGQSIAGIAGKPLSVDNIQIKVYGSGTDGTATNRQVDMCLSLDWATCYTSTVPVTLPTGADVLVGGFPDDTNFRTPFFGGWGTPISRARLARLGTVNTSGTAITYATGDGFDQDWVAGTRVWVNGTLATVASVASPTSMVVLEDLGTQSGVAYEFAAALMIRKSTGVGSINFSGAHTVTTSMVWDLPPGGSYDACSPVKSTFSVDRDGNPSAPKAGQMCAVRAGTSGSGAIYWLADDGESRIFSVFRFPASGVVNSMDPDDQPFTLTAYPFSEAAFSPTVSTRWFTQSRCGSSGSYRCIYQLDYVGDGREWRPSPRYPVAAETQPASPSDDVEWTNLTLPSAGMDVDAQITSGFAGFDPAKWGTLAAGVSTFGVTGKYMMLSKNGYGVNEGPVAFTFVFDVTTGLFVRAWDSYSGTLSPYMRWQAHHASLALGTGSDAGLVFQSYNPNGHTWGRYTSTVSHLWRSGSANTDTALPASYDATYDGDCPANPYGAVSPNCIKIRIVGQPCKTATFVNEATWFPCPWDPAQTSLSNIAVGDMFADVASHGGGTYNLGESFQVLAVTVNNPTDVEIVAMRDAVPVSRDPRCSQPRTHLDNWTLAMAKGGTRSCEVNSLFIDPATGEVNASVASDHFDAGVGPTAEFRWVSMVAYPDGGLSEMTTTYPPLTMAYNPTFAGVSTNGIPPMQSYPSGRQWTAANAEKVWTLNHRHWTEWGTQTLTQVSGNLYMVATIGTTDVKRAGWIVNASGTLLTEKNPGTTGDTITPSDTWRFCYAYRDNECRTGATAGTMYVVVPGPLNGYCGEFSLTSRSVCAFAPNSVGGWGVQEISTANNTRGRWSRRLTMQPGPQRHPVYENDRPLPDGKLFVFRSSWTDGLYTTLMVGLLPPMVKDSMNRTTFQPVAVRVGAGVVANNALVRFWYDEHNGYCSSRQEACYASAATVTESNPFLYTHELASGSGVACASGCTVSIPAISNRVLYFEVVNNASGSLSTVQSRSAVAVH